MADEKKHKKRKPRRIITTRHDDNTYSHEHQHDDGKHSMFAGTSANVDDVKQHMDDNFGGPDDLPKKLPKLPHQVAIQQRSSARSRPC
jgi:hypothetical protein